MMMMMMMWTTRVVMKLKMKVMMMMWMVSGVLKDADVTLTGGSEEEKDGNEDSLRKYSDTRLVSLKIRFAVTCSHSPLSLDQCKMLSFCVLDNSVAV